MASRRLTRDRQDDLDRWLEPLLDALPHRARRRKAPAHLAGLILPAERRNVPLCQLTPAAIIAR